MPPSLFDDDFNKILNILVVHKISLSQGRGGGEREILPGPEFPRTERGGTETEMKTRGNRRLE